MSGLTDRQQLVLDFIRQSIVDRGYPPTLREICKPLGTRSTNGARNHLAALERKGFIVRDEANARGIRLVAPVIPSVSHSPAGSCRVLRDARCATGRAA